MDPQIAAEKADRLSHRRARMLPFLAVIFISQQAAFLTPARDGDAYFVKISAWLVLSAVLLAALATKGFWLQPKEVRDLLDDENTRSNRLDSMSWGFIASMVTGIAIYSLALLDNIKGRESIHIILSAGLAAALIRWGYLERRAHRGA